MMIEPCEPRRLLAAILFVRGAERSGGFLEATDDAQRTEHLADLNNTSTAAGNHGWGLLAETLRAAGHTLTQVVEPLEADAPGSGQTSGAPLRLEKMNLPQYDAVVFGSNNAKYTKKQLDAVDSYVRGGGAALFISDGNFGSDWADAANSDQQFLNRFGLVVNQDHGQYVLDRDTGDFSGGSHPILAGIEQIDGEGVSPLRAADNVASGISIRRLVGARDQTNDNNGTAEVDDSRGTRRAVNNRDSTLIVATVGSGRVAGHFDRNTFFNDNGAGTDITRFDNRQYALNLFAWLADDEVPGVAATSYRVEDDGRRTARIVFNDNLAGSLTTADVRVRDRITGRVLPRSNYTLRVVDEDNRSTLTVRLRGLVDAGGYRIEIRENAIADTAGNRRRAAIRFNFDAD